MLIEIPTYESLEIDSSVIGWGDNQVQLFTLERNNLSNSVSLLYKIGTTKTKLWLYVAPVWRIVSVAKIFTFKLLILISNQMSNY